MSESGSVASLGASTKPLSSFKGYKPEFVLQDVVAGIVIAALSIPIAMGYADIAGLPPEYGLYASFVAPLVFALVTGTRHIVFGMDSAAVAMTGSMLAAIGITLGTGEVVRVMPMLTLFVAAFLILFSVLKAGRIIRLVPMPVMHGFIAGISLTVILTQIPHLLGTAADTSGPFWMDVVNVAASLRFVNAPSALVAAGSAVIILAIKRHAPKIPSALVALLIATVVSAVFRLSEHGVVMLNAVQAGFPLPAVPDFTAYGVLATAGAALAIALVVALESLLCLETFSIKAGTRSNGSRELLSFGIANAVCCLFACPPCSASISRTAAGMSAGGRTQLASIVSALVVAAVVFFLGPVLQFMPRAALSVIVTIALVEVCDFGKISRYAKHMKAEFSVFLVAFAAVIFFGAVPGILSGFALAVVFAFVRKKRNGDAELMGAVPYGKYESPDGKKRKKADPGLRYEVLRLEGDLSFLNVDRTIDLLAEQIKSDTEAVIINLNKVTSIDTTATDKITQLLDMLFSRGVNVKLVRKVRPTNDTYTRFELRQLMHNMKFYPSVRFALMSLKSDKENQIDPQRASGWLSDPDAAASNEGDSANIEYDEEVPFKILSGDQPVLTVNSWELSQGKKSTKRILHAKLTYLQSQEVLLFDAGYNPEKPLKAGKRSFDTLKVFHSKSGELVARYKRGGWEWLVDEENLENAITIIDAYVRKVRLSEETKSV